MPRWIQVSAVIAWIGEQPGMSQEVGDDRELHEGIVRKRMFHVATFSRRHRPGRPTVREFKANICISHADLP